MAEKGQDILKASQTKETEIIKLRERYKPIPGSVDLLKEVNNLYFQGKGSVETIVAEVPYSPNPDRRTYVENVLMAGAVLYTEKDKLEAPIIFIGGVGGSQDVNSFSSLFQPVGGEAWMDHIGIGYGENSDVKGISQIITDVRSSLSGVSRETSSEFKKLESLNRAMLVGAIAVWTIPLNNNFGVKSWDDVRKLVQDRLGMLLQARGHKPNPAPSIQLPPNFFFRPQEGMSDGQKYALSQRGRQPDPALYYPDAPLSPHGIPQYPRGSHGQILYPQGTHGRSPYPTMGHGMPRFGRSPHGGGGGRGGGFGPGGGFGGFGGFR